MYYLIYLTGFFMSAFKRSSKAYIFLFLLLLLLLSIFRFGVGPDYFSYKFLFERLNSSPILEFREGLDGQELFFRLLGSSMKTLGFTYQMYLSSFAFVTLLYTYRMIKDYAEDRSTSLFLYYCFFYFVWIFSGIRQGIVLSVGVYYLLKFIDTKDYRKMLIVTIILSGIHISAIFLFILFLLNMFELSKKRIIIISLTAIIFSFLPIRVLVEYCATVLPMLTRVTPYLSESSYFFDIAYLIRLILLVAGIFFYDIFQNKKNHKIIIDTYLLSLCVYFMLSFSKLTAARISVYGYYLVILVIPMILNHLRKYYNEIIILILLFTGSFIYFNKEIIAMKNQSKMVIESYYVPYTNVLYENSSIEFNNRYVD